MSSKIRLPGKTSISHTDSGKYSARQNIDRRLKFYQTLTLKHIDPTQNKRSGQTNTQQTRLKKEIKMKKIAAVLFVFFAVFSNVTFANDKDCHPEKEHCEKH